MAKCIMPQVFIIGGGDDTGIGEYLVRFIDYDGTLLKQKRVDSGGSVTAPTAPAHTGLTFQEWSHTTSNVTSDMNVGATYTTTDGKTMLYLHVTATTGKAVVLYLNKSNTATLTVDWGDGSTNSTFTNSGNFNTGTHTYANYGDYEVKMWISSGSGTYGFGNGTNVTTVVGGDTQIQRDMLLYAFVGDSVTSIGSRAFENCKSLTNTTIPNNVTDISYRGFYACSSLTSVVIPNSVESIGGSGFSDCSGLTSITIPNSVTSIYTWAFAGCRRLTNIIIPNSIISINDYTFSGCNSITNIVIPNSVTSIGNYAFQYWYSLTDIVIPNSVTSIGQLAFRDCPFVKTYVFERTAGVTTIGGTNTFTGINAATKIYVPNALVSLYKAATNWSTYANYIYSINEKGV